MRRQLANLGLGHRGVLWPMLLLLIVVIIPTIGILAFVSIAMRNEQLASRQRLLNAYQLQLELVRNDLNEHWRLAISKTPVGSSTPSNPRLLFYNLVAADSRDSVLCLNENGEIAYPHNAPLETADVIDEAYLSADRHANETSDLSAALEIYRQIEQESTDKQIRAVALRSQTRCLLKLKKTTEAVELVKTKFTGELSQAQDAGGRNIAANVELMILESANNEHTAGIRRRLADRLVDYDSEPMSSVQRLFLMNRLEELAPGSTNAKLLQAENLAARFLAAHPQPLASAELRPSQLPDVYQIALPNRSALLLISADRVVRKSQVALAKRAFPAEAFVTLLPPGRSPPNDEIASTAAGDRLPGWRISLATPGGEIESSTHYYETLYGWAGVLVVLSTAILALAIAIVFRRRIQVANLKNDLVGTVSHELKTPLSSMRLLVDTLLESKELQPQQTREYLQLIAKENMRLTRLIENFLTFSKLEQGEQFFEFRAVDAAELVHRCVEAAGDRFREPECCLSVNVASNLPQLRGDEDSLVIVLLNLLDNAFKYSSEPREITISAGQQNGSVQIDVTDNGEGMSRGQAAQAFRKFYQVDQSLVREGQGCGLGLSIVNYIVQSHGGTATVASEPKTGSTFTIAIPCFKPQEEQP